MFSTQPISAREGDSLNRLKAAWLGNRDEHREPVIQGVHRVMQGNLYRAARPPGGGLCVFSAPDLLAQKICMLEKLREAFYWLSGAAVQIFCVMILLGLTLGVILWATSYSCEFLSCTRTLNWLETNPGGILLTIAIIVGLYIQVRWPIDIRRPDSIRTEI